MKIFDSLFTLEDGLTKKEIKIAKIGWLAAKHEILSILKDNKELESISHNGKKVYKIYGTVIEKIKQL